MAESAIFNSREWLLAGIGGASKFQSTHRGRCSRYGCIVRTIVPFSLPASCTEPGALVALKAADVQFNDCVLEEDHRASCHRISRKPTS